jgi:hypothetical protein
MKCSYNFLHVRGLQWEQSRTYVSCCRNSHIHPYKIFWVREGPYKLTTGDLNMLYRWSAADLWEENISRRFVEVWFSDLYGYWRTRLFSVLVTLEDKVVLIFW